MTAETAEKLKKTELEILKTFIKICDENKLQYYLIGGSAIGAIRHNGFIPWDDDIDVGMPRKDYNIFYEQLSTSYLTTIFCKHLKRIRGI